MRPKMGFGVPLDQWFRGELRELVHDTLLDQTARQRGWFRADVWKARLASTPTARSITAIDFGR